jgi:dihydrofolate reductase
MAATVYYAAMSLDGYIAEPEEKLGWLTGFDGPGYAGTDGGPVADSFADFMEGVGALVMGSKTYDFILNENEAWVYDDLPAWVYTSRELPKLDEAVNLEFTSGDVTELHAEMLEAAGDKDLWLVGGGDLASQYVEAGLLDHVRVTVVPIILGDGFPLFAKPMPEAMKLIGMSPFDTGMVELDYEIVR